MKLNVKLQNEWFVLPVKEKSKKVAWIVEECIRRYLCYSTEKRKQLKTEADFELHKLDSNNNGFVLLEGNEDYPKGSVDSKKVDRLLGSVVEIRKNATNAILNSNDLIHEVLNDDDFLCIGELNQLMRPGVSKRLTDLRLPNFFPVLKSNLESFYQERTVDKLQSLALNLGPNKNERKPVFYLDGNTLKPDNLFELGLGKNRIDVSYICEQLTN